MSNKGCIPSKQHGCHILHVYACARDFQERGIKKASRGKLDGERICNADMVIVSDVVFNHFRFVILFLMVFF